MATIFMNSKNSKTSDPYRLVLNLSDKINSNRSDQYVPLSNHCNLINNIINKIQESCIHLF